MRTTQTHGLEAPDKPLVSITLACVDAVYDNTLSATSKNLVEFGNGCVRLMTRYDKNRGPI